MKKPQRRTDIKTCLNTATATTFCLSEAVIIHFISSNVMTTLKIPYWSRNLLPKSRFLPRNHNSSQSIELMKENKKKKRNYYFSRERSRGGGLGEMQCCGLTARYLVATSFFSWLSWLFCSSSCWTLERSCSLCSTALLSSSRSLITACWAGTMPL